MIIDLRSDTVTRPTPEMLEAMMNAECGDDVFGEDPTVIDLEKKTAKIFGKEAGLFCPSGTMTNQVAIKVHTKPGDEVICDVLSHIYNYEGGGIAFNSGCSVRLLNGDRGRFKAEDVLNAINPDDVHYPVSSLVGVENTCNKGGGCTWNLEEIEKISRLCKEKKLKFHLDGARIFNAALLYKPDDFFIRTGSAFDSISICLSKGLGSPAGSVLIGDELFIKKARRVRKVLGGGMRQAGYLAAAGIYALNHHVERLKDDHARAGELGKIIEQLSFVEELFPVESNIVIFRLADHYKADAFISDLASKGIKVIQMGPQKIRMVTHLDFTNEMLEKVVGELKKMNV